MTNAKEGQNMKKTFLLLIAGIMTMLLLCGCSGKSNTSYDRTDDSWELTFKPLCTTIEEDFTLKSGDRIAVEPQLDKGKIKIRIAQEGGLPIYEGNGGIGRFEVTADKDGAYTFSVSGENAYGQISFKILN